MAAIYGDGFLKLRPDLTGFGTEVNAKMKGAGLTGALGKVGKAAGLAFVAGTAAAIGVGIKGVVDFAGFERQMNEVFTLLPGISGEAMDEMSGQVQDFSREFGTLPTEVVPALYQSLSAGVPPDNVFAFMETAQKAALGGATELETAVDGISSVVNAYGADILSAEEASDLMFTAVRLGKTDFDQLSNSLFNVTPTASALGVQFGDVTAALATMTAQGTPTSVATTQLRQLFVELSKEGGKASDAFKEMSGKSFQEFIAEGGNVAEALEVMQDAAGESGVQLQDMFGSVEAGAAALSLSGGDSFTDALAEMGDAAGATEGAFDQMDQGLSRSWDKIKAAIANALLDIGQRLAPFIQRMSDFLAVNLPIWIETASQWFDRLSDWWNTHGPAIVATVKGVFDGIRTVIETVVGVIQTVIGWFQQAESSSESSFGGIAAFAQETWPKVQEIIEGVMEVIRTVIETVTAIVGAIWEKHGERIMAIVSAVWDNVKTIITTVLGVIKGVIDVVMGLLTGDWDRAWEGIKGIVSSIWEGIKSVVENALEIIKNIIPIALDFIKETWNRIWDTIYGIIGAIWDDITGAIEDGIENVKSFFTDLPGNILEWLGDMGTLLVGVAGDLIGGLVKGIRETAGRVIEALKRYVLDKVPDFVKSFFGIGSPAKLMIPFGMSLPEGMAVGVERGADVLHDSVEGLTRNVSSALRSTVEVGTGVNTTTSGVHLGGVTFQGTPESMIDDLMRRQDRELRMTS